jgi:uncharacterized protein (DUF1778 family)
MTTKTKRSQIGLRIDPETIGLINAAAKRRRTKPAQWMRDALNLALELENGARS